MSMAVEDEREDLCDCETSTPVFNAKELEGKKPFLDISPEEKRNWFEEMSVGS